MMVDEVALKVKEFVTAHKLDGMAEGELNDLIAKCVQKSKMRVTVKVPATTANLGPGYDVVGIHFT